MTRVRDRFLTGFTLIEITIALLILAVGLVGILSLFPVGFDASSRAAHTTEATFLAQGLLENIKREGYDGETVQTGLGGTEQSGVFDSPYDYYSYEISVTDIISGSLCEVDVRVSWPAGGASQRSIELKTFIAKYEP